MKRVARVAAKEAALVVAPLAVPITALWCVAAVTWAAACVAPRPPGGWALVVPPGCERGNRRGRLGPPSGGSVLDRAGRAGSSICRGAARSRPGLAVLAGRQRPAAVAWRPVGPGRRHARLDICSRPRLARRVRGLRRLRAALRLEGGRPGPRQQLVHLRPRRDRRGGALVRGHRGRAVGFRNAPRRAGALGRAAAQQSTTTRAAPVPPAARRAPFARGERPSTAALPRCAGSSATCTTAPRPGSWRWA